MERLGKDHADELCAADEKKIRFNRFGISGFEVCKSERILESVDRSFHEDTVLVEVVPMLRIARDTGTGSEILIRVCIGAFTIGRVRTGLIAGANACVAALFGFRANPFETP